MRERSRGRSLKSLTILYAIGNFGAKGFSFILIFFMTYFLSREEIGQYDLIITTVALIAPCAILSLDFALFRWLVELGEKQDYSGIFRNVFGVVLLSSLLYSLIYWVGISFVGLSEKLHTPVFIYSLLAMWFPLLQQGTRGLGMNELYISSSLLYSFLFVIISLYCLKANLGLEGILYANSMGLLVSIIWMFLKNRIFKFLITPQIDFKLVKNYLYYSLPLLPNTLSWWLISSATRYVILLYRGQESNGIFSVSYKYPMIILIFSDVFALAWQEKLIKIKSNEEAEKYFKVVLTKYLGLLFGFAIVLCSLCRFLIHFVDDNFYESWQYIPILLLAVLMQALAIFYSVPYLRDKRSSSIFYSSLTGGIFTIVSSLFLVKFGLFGISVSILLGFAVMLLYRVINVNTFFLAKFPVSKFVELAIIYSIVAFGLYSGNQLLQLGGGVIAFFTFIIYNKNLLEEYVFSIKAKFEK